jgi:hypothetical protein
MVRRLANSILALLILGLSAWIGHATAVRRMPRTVWDRPQPFPPGAAVRVKAEAPYGSASQKALRNFLFARENGVLAEPEVGSGVRRLEPGTAMAFLGADAEMAWVRDPDGLELWVAVRALQP